MSIEEYNNLKPGDKVTGHSVSALINNNSIYTVESKYITIGIPVLKVKEIFGYVFHYNNFKLAIPKKVKKNIG